MSAQIAAGRKDYYQELEIAQRGALVAEVMPQSPAEKSGLRGSEEPIPIRLVPCFRGFGAHGARMLTHG